MGVEYSNERLTLHIVRCWGWGLALFGFQVWYAWMVLPEAALSSGSLCLLAYPGVSLSLHMSGFSAQACDGLSFFL